MTEIHAHEVLRMTQGTSYTKATLKEAIIEKYGESARFNTCSANDMDADQIIDFLESKGKFRPTSDGFTVDLDEVCSDY